MKVSGGLNIGTARLARDTVQCGLFHPRVWVRGVTVLGLCLAVAVPTGAIIGLLGSIYGSATLVAVLAAGLMLRSLLFGLSVLVAVICLLPFAALPVDIGFSPTLLDLVLLALFFVWVARIASHKEQSLVVASPTAGVLAFVLFAVAAFIAGLSHAPLTANLVRHFAEIILSILTFLLIINAVRSRAQLRVLMLVLILAGFLAALAGVVLYFLPRDLTVRLLSTLRVVRYPAGSDVLRYIEDNPDLSLRATSTSIDPNVLGGMLIFTTSLAAAQLSSKNPILPRHWLSLMLLTMGLCMILTFSRGSFGGLVVAIFGLGILRYRRVLWVGIAVLIAILFLPATQTYVEHAIAGLRGEDLATQMRLGEYKDAFILISRHPWLGVGFSGTAEIDTYIGVSSVYLLIAEEMGVIGLLAFLGTLLAFLVNAFTAFSNCPRDSELEPVLLGTGLAVVGAMSGGLLDHYLFNIDFPHAAALLWLVVGLGTASIRLLREQEPYHRALYLFQLKQSSPDSGQLPRDALMDDRNEMGTQQTRSTGLDTQTREGMTEF